MAVVTDRPRHAATGASWYRILAISTAAAIIIGAAAYSIAESGHAAAPSHASVLEA